MKSMINQLASGCSVSSTTLEMQSRLPSLATVSFLCLIDDEQILCTNVTDTTWTVVRGQNGTVAAYHTYGSHVSEIGTLRTPQDERILQQSHESCKYQLFASKIAGFSAAATAAADWDGAVAGATWTADVAAHVRLLNQSTGVIYTLTTATTCTATGETAHNGAEMVVTGSAGRPTYSDTAATGEATPVFELILAPGDSIAARKIAANGETSADVSLPTDASTVVLPVTLTTLQLTPSTIYHAVVHALVIIRETAVPEIVGSIDLECDMRVVVDEDGNVFCGFYATQSPDLSRLVGTELAGATLAFAETVNGFTVMVMRPAGVTCSARCSWTTNYFDPIAAASDIPQAGSWSTGGYWDADHGVGGTPSAVTSMTSREGASVVTTSGGTVTIANDPLTDTDVMQGDGTAVMTEINARWAAFGGTHTPFILFVQYTVPTSESGTLQKISNGSNTNRVCQVAFGGGYRVKDAALIVQAYGMPAAGQRNTVVFVLHTDGYYYCFDEAGNSHLSGPKSDLTIGELVVDRFVLGSNCKFRRWGAKLPATTNPLIEAQQLYAQLAVKT